MVIAANNLGAVIELLDSVATYEKIIGRKYLHFIIMQGWDSNERSHNGETPLHVAALTDNDDIVKELLLVSFFLFKKTRKLTENYLAAQCQSQSWIAGMRMDAFTQSGGLWIFEDSQGGA